MSGLLVGALAIATILLALWLYGRVGGASHTLSDVLALGSSMFWILAGLSLMIGGFVAIGMIIILLFSFIAIGKADRLSEQDLRGRLSN